MRKGALIDVSRAALEARMRRYLDPNLSFEALRAENVGPVTDAGRFVAKDARKKIVSSSLSWASRSPFRPWPGSMTG